MLGHDIPIVRIEDLLVYKLIAGRPQDVADAVELVRAQGTRLDRAYLDATLAEWDLGSELQRVEAMAAG